MSGADFFDRLERGCSRGHARSIALQDGEALFRQGDEPTGLPYVAEGRIDLVRWTEAGGAIRIHVARAGETFAEASLYADCCHCDAVAVGSALVRLLPRRQVLDAFDTDPALSQAFTAHLARTLMQARHLLELRATTPLKRRLRARLEELADPGGMLPDTISLKSLAADLGVTPAALYRTVAAMEQSGALERPGRGRVKLLPDNSRKAGC